MIYDLKKRFVIIIMSIVSILLAIIFVTIYLSSKQTFYKNSVRNLDSNAYSFLSFEEKKSIPSYNKDFNEPDRIGVIKRHNDDFVVIVNSFGDVLKHSNYQNVIDDEETLKYFITETLNSKKNIGEIKNFNFRFKKYKFEKNILISYVNFSYEKEFYSNQLVQFIVIFFASFIIFFMLSVFLSSIAVKPIEKSYEKQKQFVQDASHELRTPLTVIISNLSLIKSNNSFSKETSLQLENIDKESSRMKCLIEDLLFLATNENTTTSNNFATLNLSDVLTEVCMLYEIVFFENHKKLEYDIQENIFITGENNLIKQVINIFLDNCKKYSLLNTTTKVKLYSQGKYTCLVFSNETENFNKDDLNHIFDRFYKKDNARKSNSRSYGLGLNIANEIVKNHNGTIKANLLDNKIEFIIKF